MTQQVEANFDRETLSLLRRVLVEAEQRIAIEARTSEIRVRLASGILRSAREGERNPRRLCSAGLRGKIGGWQSWEPRASTNFANPTARTSRGHRHYFLEQR